MSAGFHSTEVSAYAICIFVAFLFSWSFPESTVPILLEASKLHEISVFLNALIISTFLSFVVLDLSFIAYPRNHHTYHTR